MRLRATVVKVNHQARFCFLKPDTIPHDAFASLVDVTNADGLFVGAVVWADITKPQGRYRARNITLI